MSDEIEFHGVPFPAPPRLPEDEPGYDAEFIEGVSCAYCRLPPETRPARMEVQKLLSFWRSERPAMWQRLRQAGLARRYAILKIIEHAAMQSTAIAEGAKYGLCPSESLLEYGTRESLDTPEQWDYETALDEWRDRICAMGFDPDEVLRFREGLEKVGRSCSKATADFLLHLKTALNAAVRAVLRSPHLSANDVRQLAGLLALVSELPQLPADQGMEVFVHARPPDREDSSPSGLRFMVTREAAEVRFWNMDRGLRADGLDELASFFSDETIEGTLSLDEWLRCLGALVGADARISIRTVSRRSRLHEIAWELGAALLDFQAFSPGTFREAENALERRGVLAVDLPREQEALASRLASYLEMFPSLIPMDRFPAIREANRAEWLWERLLDA